MKSVQINKYGDNDVLEINENTSQPALKEGQILIENYASSINAIDWKFRAGYLQKMAPVTLPVVLGGDFAGKIVRVSEEVNELKIGDEVYGQAIILNGGSGSMAEVVAANSINTARKPKTIGFEEASALPLVGVSALQAIEGHMKLKSGQKVLIHGGAGGIGHIAVQLAKALGAYVAATAKTEDIEFVKGLGADEVIDYKTQKFEELLNNFDGVFDTVGGETVNKSFSILKKGGILVSMLGEPDQELAKKYDVIAVGQMTKTDTIQLNSLAALIDSGQINVHIDKIFPIEQVKEAFTYQEKVHPRGKVVIKIKE